MAAIAKYTSFSVLANLQSMRARRIVRKLYPYCYLLLSFKRKNRSIGLFLEISSKFCLSRFRLTFQQFYGAIFQRFFFIVNSVLVRVDVSESVSSETLTLGSLGQVCSIHVDHYLFLTLGRRPLTTLAAEHNGRLPRPAAQKGQF